MASLADALAYQAKRYQYMDDMTAQPSDLEKAVQDQFGMQPNMDRGALLPYKSKDKGWVAPEVAYQLAKLLASPYVAMHGGNISPQEAIESANTLSGFMTPAGLLSKPSPGMARMNVYHGSPHKFEPTPNNPLGEFTASKIGTGEGAAAYGHGLYFAESPAVATSYANSMKALGPNMKYRADGSELKGLDSSIAADIASNGKTIAASNAKANGPEWVSAFEKLKDKNITYGQLYKVDLPDEQIAKMLDWDKPLSEQSAHVQNAVLGDINSAIEQTKARMSGSSERKAFATKIELEKLKKEKNRMLNLFGENLYKQMSLGEGNFAPDASSQLRQLGIPGIKYLDEQSRAKGAGTRNFVVFPGEEKNLKILSRE